MDSKNKTYKAMVSSDWNECLAPCGPFDFISINYPELESDLKTIFKHYTGNIISLGDAVCQIQKLLPAPITKKQMDAGYFQRIFARGFLPHLPVLSAHPMVRYAHQNTDPDYIFDLFEIKDKLKNTEAVARSFGIPFNKIILMGDSGGDGPHFKWGAGINALLIGSMTKPSLKKYCAQHNVKIGIEFGISYADREDRDQQKEMLTDFMDLLPLIENFLDA
jgi:hypothetical protein